MVNDGTNRQRAGHGGGGGAPAPEPHQRPVCTSGPGGDYVDSSLDCYAVVTATTDSSISAISVVGDRLPPMTRLYFCWPDGTGVETRATNVDIPLTR